jgi:hypothetical protein
MVHKIEYCCPVHSLPHPRHGALSFSFLGGIPGFTPLLFLPNYDGLSSSPVWYRCLGGVSAPLALRYTPASGRFLFLLSSCPLFPLVWRACLPASCLLPQMVRLYPSAVCYRRWYGAWPTAVPLGGGVLLLFFSSPLLSTFSQSSFIFLAVIPAFHICNTRRGRVASASCRSESSNISLVVLDQDK